jgi:hypothetical protein
MVIPLLWVDVGVCSLCAILLSNNKQLERFSELTLGQRDLKYKRQDVKRRLREERNGW